MNFFCLLALPKSEQVGIINTACLLFNSVPQSWEPASDCDGVTMEELRYGCYRNLLIYSLSSLDAKRYSNVPGRRILRLSVHIYPLRTPSPLLLRARLPLLPSDQLQLEEGRAVLGGKRGFSVLGACFVVWGLWGFLVGG